MRRVIQKSLAQAMDAAMCGMMNALQWRRRSGVCTRAELDAYLTACEMVTREEFYPMVSFSPRREDIWLRWESPVSSGFAENDKVKVRLYLCDEGFHAPTVIILHALMSANDLGYQRVARWFNAHGWNVAFPHLPFHYSRTPGGYFNGELAITANLVRNAETLRQGVMELRQLMGWLREHGTPEFGVIGTSYGGWNAALLSSLEEDLRFVGLVQPIVNVEAAIWENPTAAVMRRLLARQGISRGEIVRHAHLSSPMHGIPLCGGDRVIVTAGAYDTVSPRAELVALRELWPGATLLDVKQGHFGYSALRETLREIARRLGVPDAV